MGSERSSGRVDPLLVVVVLEPCRTTESAAVEMREREDLIIFAWYVHIVHVHHV